MTPEAIQAKRDAERQKDSLCQLDGEFYADCRAYFDELREEIEAADDEAERAQLNTELGKAESAFEALIDRRQGKLLKQASLASTGFPADTEGMSESEDECYEDLLDVLEGHRELVFGEKRED